MSVARLSEKEYQAHLAKQQAWRGPVPHAEVVIAADKKARPSKHRNVKTTVDGVEYDSKKEAQIVKQHRSLAMGGWINRLSTQTEFYLGIQKDDAGHEFVCKYIADLTFFDQMDRYHVVDIKSEHTRTLPVYRLKKKLMKACLGIEIEEL